jgi:hypothetical protein
MAAANLCKTWVNTKFVVGGYTGHINVAGVPPGGYVEHDNDTQVTPDVVLGPIDHQGGYLPIRSMLREFSRKVSKTIDTVESQTS